MQLSTPPQKPSKPNIPINAMLGLVGGLTGGVFIAFFLENMDTSIRTIEEVEALTSLPVLARVPEIPKLRMLREKSQDLRKNGHFSSLGLYHPLVMHLLAFQASSPLRSILVTSPEPSTGKSTVTAQLGLTLAQTGNRVILVDANLRRPNLQRLFRLPNDPGLSTVLGGKMLFNSETPSYQVTPKLRVLTAGHPSNNPSALFTKSSVDDLLDRLSNGVDNIIIDSPAMLSVSEAGVLASQVDVVVMVVALGHTEPGYLHQTIRQLNDMGVKVIGVVVNRIPSPRLLNY